MWTELFHSRSSRREDMCDDNVASHAYLKEEETLFSQCAVDYHETTLNLYQAYWKEAADDATSS